MAIIDTGFEGTPLREIIQLLGNKDYPYVEFRCKWEDNGEKFDEFFGACAYTVGSLVPLDGDTYSLDDLYAEWEEWVDIEEMVSDNGALCLTVWESGVVVAK